MKESSRASAPAKVIMFGEHFVIYNRLAVAAAIDLRAYVNVGPRPDNKIVISSGVMGSCGEFTLDGGYAGDARLKPIYIAAKNILNLTGERVGLDISIESQIPIAAGLGSSAAVLVATTAAVGSLLELNLDKDNIFRLALEAERIVHENPSGIDPAVSTYGGILVYRRSEGARRLNVNMDLPMVLGDTRVKRETREMILLVGELRRLHQELIDGIMDIGNMISNLAIKALESRNLESLGRFMNVNHALLYAIGISNWAIENLVWAARRAGALGAKLTGAGGGGCIIALSTQENMLRVAEAIKMAGGEPFMANIAYEGVRIEE
ncbi:MAG: mevalonate kinase [Candidatus Bathyarchaeia archaeon]